ncbi:MAG: TRAP transporter substrate-binding protein DctP [Elusimicrobia bacterium]|nr:TRAP transporter substrate-binding protein DctP [Elusimicrobiota bacterium]
MNSFRTLALVAALAGAAFPSRSAAADQKVIKFATLAPEGSTWMKVLGEMNAELQEKSSGRLKFKIYPGGVQGDEKDVVRKMRIGQLHAGGFTGVGIGELAPKLRLLDAPWLFNTPAELEHVHKNFDKDFIQALAEAGYVLLGWSDLGSVYVFSKTPFQGPEEMKKAKMWVWEGDPIAEAAYKAIGISPIPLSVVDVLSSLQTGLIDAVYGPPMGVIALQWFTRTKHIYPVPMAEASGAVLLSKKTFDSLAPEDQKVLTEVCSRHLKRLLELTRKENADAFKTLLAKGLAMSAAPSADTVKLYRDLGIKARRTLAGRLYPQELLDRVEKSLEEFRSQKGKKAR